jgi:DNA-binding MarR family transcriptional regulator
MSRSRTANRRDELSGELLELFYTVHYRVGMALEDALRDGRLTRKQVAILWLIRAIGGERRGLSRKQIQQAVTDWFEVSNSQITKALRAMARPPLGLVQIVEDPKSGREKQVLLTASGERLLHGRARARLLPSSRRAARARPHTRRSRVPPTSECGARRRETGGRAQRAAQVAFFVPAPG